MSDRRPHWDDALLDDVQRQLSKPMPSDQPVLRLYAVIAAVEDWVLHQPIFDWHVTTKHAQDKAEVERLTERAEAAEAEAERLARIVAAVDWGMERRAEAAEAEVERLTAEVDSLRAGAQVAQAAAGKRIAELTAELAERDRRIAAALARCDRQIEVTVSAWSGHRVAQEVARILRGESDE